MELKVKSFMILLLNNKFPEYRVRIKYAHPGELVCRWCFEWVDILHHRYFSCPHVKVIWKQILKHHSTNSEIIWLNFAESVDILHRISAFATILFQIHKGYFLELDFF